MSKKSYINGFYKAAAAKGVDPLALAEMTTVKKAAPNSIWGSVLDAINKVKGKWDRLTPEYKPLVGGLAGAGGGAIGGALAGKLFGFGAGKGALAGAGLGGLGGALYGANVGMKQRSAIINSLNQKKINEEILKKIRELQSQLAEINNDRGSVDVPAINGR